MEKTYKTPPVVWLKVTDYMQGWLQYELGSSATIRGQHVVCLQHIPGARDVLRMETIEDMMDKKPVGIAMSGTRKNCVTAGLDLDEDVMSREYGVTKELIKTFVPVECPKVCLTKNGVLRPWTLDVCFGREQARALQELIRKEFWKAVGEYDRGYARRMCGKHYPAAEMIEGFCAETRTPDIYVFAMRREWQRRVKREGRPQVKTS